MSRPGTVYRFAPLLAVAGAVGGCAFGPKALERSHGLYNDAVHRVEEEELLRNIVRLRYNETPLHLNVNSIAAQYELSAQAEARPFFEAPNPAGNTFRTFATVLPNLLVGAANRPTVTFDPADQSEAVRQYLTPITADFLVFLTQTSWPAATVIRLWVERLNGVPNAATASGPAREVTPDFARFLRVVELLQTAQDQELAAVRAEERAVDLSGPLPAAAVTAAAAVEAAKGGFEYRPHADGRSWVLVKRERRLVVAVSPGAEASPEMLELAGLLNLVPGLPKYEIAVAARGEPDPARFPSPPQAELRFVPRSTIQVLFYLSNGVAVPPDHVCAGLVRPAGDGDGQEITRGLFEVHVCQGHKPPPTAFAAVKYRGYWFYIDDRDQASKATFALMMQVGRLDFNRGPSAQRGPVLTLPAGR
jgi:hypothetical protein